MGKQKRKRRRPKFLPAFLGVFMLGYLFFFTSNWWMPGEEPKIKATAFYEVKETNKERKVTLFRWDYNEQQALMEVELRIESQGAEQTKHYQYTALERKEGKVPIKVIMESEELIVLQLKDVPKKWNEISLRIALTGEEEAFCRLYGTKDSVKAGGKIVPKPDQEYVRGNLKAWIHYYEKEIGKLKAADKKREKEILEQEKRLTGIQEELQYQTEAEQTETNGRIQAIQREIDTLQKKREEGEGLVTEYQNRIMNIQKRLEEEKTEK